MADNRRGKHEGNVRPRGPVGTWRDRVPPELHAARRADREERVLEDALCKDKSYLVFDDEEGYPGPKGARAMCKECPVSAACAARKMDLRPTYGYWAGLSASHPSWGKLAKGQLVAVVDGLKLVGMVAPEVAGDRQAVADS